MVKLTRLSKAKEKTNDGTNPNKRPAKTACYVSVPFSPIFISVAQYALAAFISIFHSRSGFSVPVGICNCFSVDNNPLKCTSYNSECSRIAADHRHLSDSVQSLVRGNSDLRDCKPCGWMETQIKFLSV